MGKRHSRKHIKGGSYSSASSYNVAVNGDANAQFDRTFSQTGPYASVPGNTIIGAQGQNSNVVGVPKDLSLIQSAGSRKRRHRSSKTHKSHKSHTKKARGGFIGPLVNDAIVPFGIMAMQQNYKKDKKLRGGFLGPVLNEAIVPFGILGMQQNYKKNKTLKGGFLGPVLNEAIVPFGILGMQQTYKKK